MPATNEAMTQRGSLTIWFDPDKVWALPPTAKRGRQPQYSDAAIQTFLTMPDMSDEESLCDLEPRRQALQLHTCLADLGLENET